MNKLSDKSTEDLRQTIISFYTSEGEDEEESSEIADDLIYELSQGNHSFELWDCMGCDDLGLVANNKELRTLYKNIDKDLDESKKGLKQ